MRRFLVSVLFALAAPLAAARLHAQAVFIDASGTGASGYDLVAYTRDSATPGLPGITASHEGVTWRFASTANRDAFLANPARYLPAYGGFCAYGVANGYKVKSDPEAFRIVDGRLYLNYSKGVQKKWLADVPGFIRKADANWRNLAQSSP